MYTQPVSTTSAPHAIKAERSLFSVLDIKDPSVILARIESLFVWGANVNELEPEYNLNLLQKMIIEGSINEEITRLLLEKGLNVNHQDADGYTALQYAICDELYDVATLLLIHGANPALVDKNNETAFDEIHNVAAPSPFKEEQRQEVRLFMNAEKDFSGQPHFDDAGLKKLTEGCPHLMHLTLRSIRVTSDGLEKALKILTNLRRLDIGYCLGIKSVKLKTLSRLEELNLSHLVCISFDNLLEEIKDLPKLKSLNLCWWNIFDSDLIKLLENFPHLKTLTLTNCKHITSNALEQAAKKHLNLKIIK